MNQSINQSIETLLNFIKMKNRIIRGIAGSFILISLLLSLYVSQNWLWFTAFVGANLLQSSITKWCLMDDILTKLGFE
jgi:disulfide bond formation protein DsbB